jgi:Ca2+-binding RTX toxin-like protein
MKRRVILAAVVALAVAMLWAPAASAAPTCFGKTATIVGVPEGTSSMSFTGTDGPDVIIGTDVGFDEIRAYGGNDLICAGGGVWDYILPGPGNDRVRGEGGPDDIEMTDSGRDVIWGGAGNDYVGFLAGGSTFYGGPGSDTVEEDSSLTSERAYGEGGNDHLTLNSGGPGDTFNGGAGTDQCDVNSADTLTSCEQVTVS